MPQKDVTSTQRTEKGGTLSLRRGLAAAAALPRAVLSCRSFFKSLFSKGEDRPLPQRTLLAAAICLPLAAICLSTVTENVLFILWEERVRGMDKAYFSNAADKGRGSTEYQVGIMLSRGEGVSRDMEKALFWLREAASQGHVDAQIALGTLYAEGEGGTPQDKAEAVNWLLALAGQGNTDAQAVLKELEKDMATDTLPEEELLARAYASLEGKGVPQDKTEAARWFRKAAMKHNIDAQWQLATLCDEGDGVPLDKAEAAYWFRKAAEQGEADAQYRLGIMYADGDGLPQDTAQALEWLRKAGEQGVAEAWYRLSVMYNTGLGLPQKKELSRDSLRETIRERKAVAAYDAGISKYKGRGTLLDPEGGLRLLRVAARLGHPKAPEILVEAALFRAWDVAKYGDAEAKYRLASRFFLGKDMPADKGKAFDWYSQAAELGYAAAQYLLGVAFYEGVDLAKDLVRARYWLEKAACQGYAGADAALERFRLEYPREYEEAAKFRRILGSYYQLVQQARNGDKQARRLLERFSFR
ncbi:tetratricopeptide repeat protein [uncultured Desulfovibrio sp.]|uniref:tetratricopeptide repeat protein n=1 Tax=uncultured Desulfovibrio sp. TaxID=167968 RepID=UPI0026119DF0|nr:tetratricopeptide repeat protein [uncultured Desulfovibrio sp.]